MNTDLNKKHLLIIDDDQELREIIQLIAESEGFATLVASNGQEAISLLKNPNITHEIDLILLDLIMPVLDGFSFLRWLRQKAKLTMPVLVLSGRKTSKTLEEVLSVGGTGLIYKPLEAKELIDRIKQELCIP